ncbi:uncharacterized protein BP5553_06886 [Venustampulla echinocandica]|uniref:Uncharacterized protein n=1 Tax=Venustampulla echinocandica TaxID=2656787 RepID=A0A370TL82_9HELO|nr:uncharacterized protein BP5553_06886 [Venustampulla echinocandica]RDL36274.1 hypothetical protein BP5553_06886 [Venustampulla echinocandica]
MAIHRTRAQTKTLRLEMAINTTAPVESPTSESLSKNRQVSSCNGVPSKAPPPLESPSEDQTTPEGPAKDRQLAEGPINDLLAGEVPEDLLAVGTPSEEQPTTEGPPAGEAPFETTPARESLTPPLQLGSPSKSQPTTEVQVCRPTEGLTTNQHTEKHPSTLESLSNGECTAKSPTTGLLQGEIPKAPTESSSQDQSTAEGPSKDHIVESLPIVKLAVEALPSPGEQLEPQKDLLPNPPSSNTVKDTSQPKGANPLKSLRILREPTTVRKDVPIICIDSDDDGDFVEILPSRQPHVHLSKRKASSSPEPFKYNGERMLSKRLKLIAEEKTNLLAPGSTKAEDESKSRRKSHTHYKFSEHDLSKFKTILDRCEGLTRLFTQQTECIGLLEALDIESSIAIAKISADSMSRNIQIRNQLGDIEEKKSAKSAELRRTTFSTIQEGTSIKQDLASWYTKEQKGNRAY